MKKFNQYLPYCILLLISILQAFVYYDIGRSLFLKFLTVITIFALYFMFAQISQRLLKIVLVLSFIFTLIFYPILTIYGKPDLNIAASILFTNASESLSYIKVVSLEMYLWLMLFLVLLVFLLKAQFAKINKRYAYFAFAFLMYFPLKKIIFYGFNPKTLLGYYSHIPFLEYPSLLGDLLVDVTDQNKMVLENAQKPSDWQILNKDKISLKKNFVIVIGESVRKDFLNSYGFTLENTPFINSSNNIQFNNFLSVSFGTVQSLTRTLSTTPKFPEYQLNNNFVNLAKLAGYETFWLSNQGQVGLYDSPNAIIGKSSNHYDFLKIGNSGDQMRISDDDLLPFFNQVIGLPSNKPKLIVIHMIGSHPSPCDRTNDKYDDFVLSKPISCYAQSVKNTDAFLSKIHSKLEQVSRTSYSLIYFSDHGLAINKDLIIAHGRNEKQVYEVPLLVWGNNVQQKQYIDAPRNGRDFLLLFSQLNGIKTNLIQDSYRFISNESATVNPFIVIGQDEKLMDFRKLSHNPIPPFKIKKGYTK